MIRKLALLTMVSSMLALTPALAQPAPDASAPAAAEPAGDAMQPPVRHHKKHKKHVHVKAPKHAKATKKAVDKTM